jgi:hypothetical protein
MWQSFPFAFHIAVQQPFKPLWSLLLLYELEPSRAKDINNFINVHFVGLRTFYTALLNLSAASFARVPGTPKP